MAFHGSLTTQEASTKDTTGDALEYEGTEQSYDISGSALILTQDDELNGGAVNVDNMEDYVRNIILYWRICLMEGDNNRTIVEEIASGVCKCTQLTLSGQTAGTSTYNYQLKGQGEYNIGDDTPESESDI